MKLPLAALCIALQLLHLNTVLAYSEAGHRVVGAVADQLIAGKPTGDAVKKLLGSVTLERASTLPDELRGEDRAKGTFTLPENPALQSELLAFRTANPPSYDDLNRIPPSHHWFHYTDVPIQSASYSATKRGTSQWDIVHMITFCARVLEGKEKPDNSLKITPAVALVLLTHYVGDIHQPLHVGAIYLNKNGDRLDPNSDPAALEDRGGNDINFGGTSLHAYWDYDAVESCLTYRRRTLGKLTEQYQPRDFAMELAKKEPINWKPAAGSSPETWAEAWANDVLPLALEAHNRLKFLPQEEFAKNRDGTSVLHWTAIEAPHIGSDSYSIWASKTVEKELPKAGWRLAAMLDATLGAPAK
ncbi:MAG: S1/P1 nuclease [Chthoniobacterales bacterium]